MQVGDGQKNSSRTPKLKKTIPRMELVAAVNSRGLNQTVRGSLKMSRKKVNYFRDLSCIPGMLQMKSGRLNEFTGTRVTRREEEERTSSPQKDQGHHWAGQVSTQEDPCMHHV